MLRPALPHDHPSIEALLDHVFGAGRFAKTAYHIRAHPDYQAQQGFVFEVNRHLIGSVQLGALSSANKAHGFLGPIAVHPHYHHRGIGTDLMQRAEREAHKAGLSSMLLIGDAGYYHKLGYVPLARADWPSIISPLEAGRVLIKQF